MAKLEPKLAELFAKRLRGARTVAGISQRELGRRIGLQEEVVSSRVARYELGTSEPDFSTAEKLAKSLGVPLAYLLADSDILATIILAVSRMSPDEQLKLLSELEGSGERSP